MKLGSDFYFTCGLLYMFRALLAPIIKLPGYELCSCHVGRWLSDVHSYQGLHIQLLYS